jgi:hypothetical protein
LAKARATARKDFVREMDTRGVPGIEVLGFSKAVFKGIFHGKEAQGAYYPMLRLRDHWLEFVDISLLTACPLDLLVQPLAFVFNDPPFTVDALQGVDIGPVMMDPGVFKTRFTPQRSRGWFLGRGGPYRVKSGLTDTRAAAVAAQVDRLLVDFAVLDKTRKQQLAKTGVYEVALKDGELRPLRLIKKGNAELRALLA